MNALPLRHLSSRSFLIKSPACMKEGRKTDQSREGEGGRAGEREGGRAEGGGGYDPLAQDRKKLGQEPRTASFRLRPRLLDTNFGRPQSATGCVVLAWRQVPQVNSQTGQSSPHSVKAAGSFSLL